MIVKQEIRRKCRACGKFQKLREYIGLTGGWYGFHNCPQLADWRAAHPDECEFNLPVPIQVN